MTEKRRESRRRSQRRRGVILREAGRIYRRQCRVYCGSAEDEIAGLRGREGERFRMRSAFRACFGIYKARRSLARNFPYVSADVCRRRRGKRRDSRSVPVHQPVTAQAVVIIGADQPYCHPSGRTRNRCLTVESNRDHQVAGRGSLRKRNANRAHDLLRLHDGRCCGGRRLTGTRSQRREGTAAVAMTATCNQKSTRYQCEEYKA